METSHYWPTRFLIRCDTATPESLAETPVQPPMSTQQAAANSAFTTDSSDSGRHHSIALVPGHRRLCPALCMIMGDMSIALYDNGFYNIGVRPSDEDLGVGGTDPFGLPLSNVGLAQLGLFDLETVFQPNEAIATRGSFKTPGLRNVALTAPYFHNGGQATLRQVDEFYNRGGDFHNPPTKDPDVTPPFSSDSDLDALVSFLESLTDERVLYRRAPFDHPELIVPHGAEGDDVAVRTDPSGAALDRVLVIDAVGAQGGEPLARFLEGC
jgi:hypothetical protein